MHCPETLRTMSPFALTWPSRSRKQQLPAVKLSPERYSCKSFKQCTAQHQHHHLTGIASTHDGMQSGLCSLQSAVWHALLRSPPPLLRAHKTHSRSCTRSPDKLDCNDHTSIVRRPSATRAVSEGTSSAASCNCSRKGCNMSRPGPCLNGRIVCG